MDELAAYLSQDRVRTLARGVELPALAHGAALFADLAGFTALTEALDRALGPRRGTEAMTDQLNQVFTALIAEVERYDGSVLGFAGDAITCWFDQQDGPAAHRAAACALALQEAIGAFAAIPLPDGRTVALGLKVAVTSGPARRLVVGEPAIQRLDVLAGTTLDRVAAGEHLAQPGEVLVDQATAKALDSQFGVTVWREHSVSGARFAVLSAAEAPPVRLPVALPPPTMLTPEQLRPWLLPAIYARHQAGLGAFLTELRPVVALFLRFGGIDYDADEEAGAKLDSFIRRVQAILARYDGNLLQLTIGDKGSFLYAAFGAPTGHEDDPQRAARAALALSALSNELDFVAPLQIGISQGALRAGAYGGPTRKTYGVLGDEVNLAARLMSHAAAGEALVSGRVRPALEREFSLEPLEPIPLKGMPEPLPVFRLAGLRRRELRLSEPAYSLPMVGRQAELATLTAKLSRALEGQGQVVGIIAEAGMGKSRLVAEALRLAQRQGLRVTGGACQSYGMSTSYLVWGAIWRGLFELDPELPLRRQLRALEGLLEEWAPERVQALPLLGPLLGLELPENAFTQHLEPQYRKSALEALLLECLTGAAREAQADGGGLLLVLEDLHWIDALSHELLERVAQAVAELPVLLVLAYRPPELLRLQAPRVEALPHFTRVELGPLSEAETAQAIRAKLAQLLPARKGAASAELIARITAKAEGNPFYVEELLNYLRDRGLDPQDSAALAALELPDSLHSLILSRIDQLSERERAALKVASVIGRLFRFAWLHEAFPMLGEAALLRDDLEALSRLDLTPLDTPEPELAYLFKHIVTQEVAYDSLTARARMSLHEQLAVYLEQLAGAETDRFVDLLAYHYERSDNLAKKRVYLRRAGEAAAARFANEAAVEYLSRALELAPEEDWEERYALLMAREKLFDLQMAREAQKQDLSTLVELAELLSDNGRRAVIAVRRANFSYFSHDSVESMAAAAKAVLLASAAGQPTVTVEANWRWAWALTLHGDFAAARTKANASLELARTIDDLPGTANALLALGDVEQWMGDYESAQDYYEHGLQIMRTLSDRRGEGQALIELANIARAQQEFGTAQAYYEQSLLLFLAIGDRLGEHGALGMLGRLALDQGDHVQAQAYLTKSLLVLTAVGDRSGGHAFKADLFVSFGWAMQCMGDYATARDYYEQGLAVAGATDDQQIISMIYINLGTLARHEGDYSTAQIWYAQAVDIARSAKNELQEAIGLWGLGNVALESRDFDTAPNFYRAAEALFEQSGHPARVIEVLAGLALVAVARADLASARASAEPIIEYLALGPLTTENTEEPFQVELSCYRVLDALGDPRAPAMLDSAYRRLQDRVAGIPDANLRRSFLENVPYHREIVAAWEATQPGEKT